MRSKRRTKEQWEAITERIQKEGAITISEAAKMIRTERGSKTSTTALTRWIVHGKKGVHLDGAMMNGKGWWTSKKALFRFFAAVSAVEAGRRQDAAEVPTSSEWDAR